MWRDAEQIVRHAFRPTCLVCLRHFFVIAKTYDHALARKRSRPQALSPASALARDRVQSSASALARWKQTLVTRQHVGAPYFPQALSPASALARDRVQSPASALARKRSRDWHLSMTIVCRS